MAAGSVTAFVPAQHRQALVVALAILATGCDARDVASDHKAGVVVVSAAKIAKVAKPSAMVPAVPEIAPKDGNSVVRRVNSVSLSATAIAAPSPVGLLPTRKTFSDPPLPAELKNDGGLVPLPPPPPPPPPARTTDR